MFIRKFLTPTQAAGLGRPRPGGYRDLHPAEVAPLLTRLRLVDVREVEEFRDRGLGRLAGAVNLPMATIEAHLADFDRTQPILLVCRSGRRSAWVAAELVGLGFAEVYNLAGGMIAWNDAGLPVLRG